ncbi:MAG: peptide chain release factor N(5)-glutamine methyltransferase [Desulfuromonadales bacterium]|nr:peptide chain release factor N(5)-glutamine methyltransferase [Desulfuromonadales bacterium]NIR34206.1 peptide chain release factor N(5)-glutamine methyltransferase [Desulfuromonadales bacterium]NIS41654.1 peptide chain release factor N(5)-glutamine methyltransferase [Desulfuromonadales bacterium]
MPEPWTVLKILEWTAGYFGEKGIDSPRLDAELLLADLLEIGRVDLYLQFDRPLTADELTDYRRRVARRAGREPLQHILGETEFWSLPLKVTPQVLVPRADTEVLVEEALKRLDPAGRVLDVGTGSGAIALALASERQQACVEAVDLCDEALAVARENAVRHGLEGRLQFRREDLAALTGGRYAMIVSNPPYIPQGDLDDLMPEVRDFEPRQALDGGGDGLDCYRALTSQAPSLLDDRGWLLVEVGCGQAEAVRGLFAAAGLTQLFVRDDYAGTPRVVGGRRESPVNDG